MVSTVGKIFGLSEHSQKSIDSFALGASKVIHSINSGWLGIDALKDNRVLDGISKILDPLMSNFSSIENMNLTKGIAGCISILDLAQEKYADEDSGKLSNLRSNFSTTIKMCKDIYNSKFFSKDRKVFISPDKEKGHSFAVAGHLTLLSSIIGLTVPSLNKFMNFFRNIGGMIVNSVGMYHPDNHKKMSGSIFNIYAVLDMVQKFMPKDHAHIINNINMALYNMGIYFYGNLSHKRTVNKFKGY